MIINSPSVLSRQDPLVWPPHTDQYATYWYSCVNARFSLCSLDAADDSPVRKRSKERKPKQKAAAAAATAAADTETNNSEQLPGTSQGEYITAESNVWPSGCSYSTELLYVNTVSVNSHGREFTSIHMWIRNFKHGEHCEFTWREFKHLVLAYKSSVLYIVCPLF